jgi:hypothetical protein
MDFLPALTELLKEHGVDAVLVKNQEVSIHYSELDYIVAAGSVLRYHIVQLGGGRIKIYPSFDDMVRMINAKGVVSLADPGAVEQIVKLISSTS